MEEIREVKFKTPVDTAALVDLLGSKGVNLNEELLENDYLADSLKHQLILSYLPELVESPKDETDIFYSRYFWSATFNKRYKEIFGEDEGLDQQLFKLCEEAEQSDLDVDWQFVEEIEKEVNEPAING